MRTSCYRPLASTLPSITLTPMLSSAVNLSKVRALMHAFHGHLMFDTVDHLTNVGAMYDNAMVGRSAFSLRLFQHPRSWHRHPTSWQQIPCI